MKILIQSSAFLPTPSPGAGAVEYIVAQLARRLASMNHEVTLFALPGSKVDGLRIKTPTFTPDPLEAERILADLVVRQYQEEGADVLFDHSLTMEAQKLAPGLPALSMCHGMAPLPKHGRNWIFTSRHHGTLHGLADAKALYLGLDLSTIPEPELPWRQDYVLWAGRIMAYKRPHLAAQIAAAADFPITLVGPIGDERYFRNIFGPPSSWKGPASHDEVLARMRNASAFLFTSDRTEPAGLVMLEALASGCPVLAPAHGACMEYLGVRVSELFQTPGEAVHSIKRHFWEEIDSRDCRAWVRDHFSLDRMGESAESYLERTLAGERW